MPVVPVQLLKAQRGVAVGRVTALCRGRDGDRAQGDRPGVGRHAVDDWNFIRSGGVLPGGATGERERGHGYGDTEAAGASRRCVQRRLLLGAVAGTRLVRQRPPTA